MIKGQCRVTTIAPAGCSQLVDFAAGDVWYFPRGFGHSIQAIGNEDCQFVLVFDNGYFSEFGTFSISDWIGHTPPDVLQKTFGVPAQTFANFPKSEVYKQANASLKDHVVAGLIIVLGLALVTLAGIFTNSVFGIIYSFAYLALWDQRPHAGGYDATDAVTYVWIGQALLMTVALWGAIGGNMMVIFLAGLQGIPQELYEAAKIDGAGAWARFRYVTFPLVSPTTFFVVVLSTIAAFQVFDQTFVMTAGGPAYSTTTLALYIYQNAFQWFHMGYAAALSYVLFAAVAVVTLVQFRVQGRFVFYR